MPTQRRDWSSMLPHEYTPRRFRTQRYGWDWMSKKPSHMSTFSFLLLQKTERIEASPAGFLHRLTFEARFPLREKLTSHLGEHVERGFVELATSQPRFDGPTLKFAKATRDPDTGKTYPPSISFYAVVPQNIFDSLVKAPQTARITLNLSTELMGAIRFNDSLGYEKVWNTDQQSAVQISYFDFSVQHDPGE